ncbi:MAG TPA: SDR family oxidoreductase [Gemmatimonadales bacterium]|nr:SDR family oxidoreductase [Gemmatimonadales bacterium]
MTIDLGGAVTFITGGGSGIGREAARRFVEAGSRVVIADVRAEAAREVAESIDPAGKSVFPLHCDVRDPGSVGEAVRQATGVWGEIDILINNAGAWTLKQFLDMEAADYDVDIGVCLFGTLYMTRAVLPAMVARKQGVIINTISDSALIGSQNATVYSAAKAGVVAFTKALAKEVGPSGIRVNGVSPGTTATPANEAARAGLEMEKFLRSYPLRRIGTPQDQANAMLFLASDLSGWITGQIIPVNGGHVM